MNKDDFIEVGLLAFLGVSITLVWLLVLTQPWNGVPDKTIQVSNQNNIPFDEFSERVRNVSRELGYSFACWDNYGLVDHDFCILSSGHTLEDMEKAVTKK